MMSVNFEHGKILQGDVLEKLTEIPSESIDCVITSPPYWGLRDYSIDGQWGLEKDFHEYLAKMQEFMKLIKIVLKKTGTCWINLGDTYAGGNTHSDFSGLPHELTKPWNEGHRFQSKHKKNQVQTKSQFGIPERFYADCIDNDWIARNFIPWVKANAMPSSIKDRFTNKWEPVMFFAKYQKYYFNLDAVREKPITETKPFNLRVRDAKKGLGQAKLGDDPKAWKMSEQEDQDYNEKGERKYSGESNSNTSRLGNYRDKQRKQDSVLGPDGKPLANYKGFNERYKKRLEEGRPESSCRTQSKLLDPNLVYGELINPKGKNPGDVFYINPRPFPEAHFATFPIDLPLKILKCSCPKQVCKKCKVPRMPIVESDNPSKEYADYENDLDFANTNQKTSNPQSSKSLHRQEQGVYSTAKIIGWTKCDCNVGFEPGVVLDPFFGAGTVGLAAEKLGLNWMGIELSLEYVKIATKRLEPHNVARLVEWM